MTPLGIFVAQQTPREIETDWPMHPGKFYLLFWYFKSGDIRPLCMRSVKAGYFLYFSFESFRLSILEFLANDIFGDYQKGERDYNASSHTCQQFLSDLKHECARITRFALP